MAEYEFECKQCKKVFTVFMRVSDRATTTVRCPGCQSEDLEPLLQTFFAKTARKS